MRWVLGIEARNVVIPPGLVRISEMGNDFTTRWPRRGCITQTHPEGAEKRRLTRPVLPIDHIEPRTKNKRSCPEGP